MIYQTWNRTVAIALGAILTLVPSLYGQSKDKPSMKSQTVAARDAAETSQGASDEKASPGGPQEGIKVHGHWTIVVRNADGGVASRHEFENALTSGGALTLAALLTQSQSTAPTWSIILDGNTGPGQSVGFVVSTTSQSVNGTVVLTGSRKVPVSGYQLTGVDTNVQITSLGATFTSRDLTQPVPPSTTAPGPISVQNGQTVDVSVVISFS